MRNVLITGGSGSFGTAFVKRLLRDSLAERICIYSRGEHRQAAMRQALKDDGRLRFLIGDVRDKDRLKQAMRGVDTVIHAAALKRIEVGQYNPTELVRTNVLGTINAVEAAVETQVTDFVLVSTDKAWQPISPYGHSKAIAENIVLGANDMHGSHGPEFSVVRYGNVWLSQGSVVPTWRDLIRAGVSKVPVTDPECTRFFMRMDEAVQFVISSIGWPGRHIPDWLPAYRLGDLVEAMGTESFVMGLPEWEKRHEGMRDDLTSDKARRMTIEELKEALANG